jgi:hypothetical protein
MCAEVIGSLEVKFAGEGLRRRLRPISFLPPAEASRRLLSGGLAALALLTIRLIELVYKPLTVFLVLPNVAGVAVGSRNTRCQAACSALPGSDFHPTDRAAPLGAFRQHL